MTWAPPFHDTPVGQEPILSGYYSGGQPPGLGEAALQLSKAVGARLAVRTLRLCLMPSLGTR